MRDTYVAMLHSLKNYPIMADANSSSRTQSKTDTSPPRPSDTRAQDWKKYPIRQSSSSGGDKKDIMIKQGNSADSGFLAG